MGIVNVTPDSFYDGGRHFDSGSAVEHGLRLAAEGADILDVGGASSRPGAPEVLPEDETARVIPVVKRLSSEFRGPVSVDTTSAIVARQAIDAGATWINDISAGRHDPKMAAVIAESGCTAVLMHSRGTPRTMQDLTGYDDVAADVIQELLTCVDFFIQQGVSRDRIIIDPGIGFAKTASQNVELLQRLGAFVNTGYPVLVGTSRKSFIGVLTGRDVAGRLPGSLATVVSAFFRGARIFRVHDVAATKDFLTVLSSVEAGSIE
ncbi:MAG: dihydropteroate synthase [Chitinispirillaceae bacterium]|nr:dihydropteroate synthase [Chitinispirillaceae bacterium]